MRLLYCNLWRRVREDVETWSTMGFMEGSFWVLLRKLLVARKLVLPRNWYCQGSKADTGKEGRLVLPRKEAG